MVHPGEPLRLDLRGVKCPLNWAHAKVRLEQMRRGQILELLLDDPRGARDIPRAAEAEGYTATRHQREVGTGYFDLVTSAISPADWRTWASILASPGPIGLAASL